MCIIIQNIFIHNTFMYMYIIWLFYFYHLYSNHNFNNCLYIHFHFNKYVKSFLLPRKTSTCFVKALLPTTQNLKLSHNKKKFNFFFHVKVVQLLFCELYTKANEALLIGEHGNFALNLNKSGTLKSLL